MNTGLTVSQMQGFIDVLKAKVGQEQAAGAEQVLTEVVEKRK